MTRIVAKRLVCLLFVGCIAGAAAAQTPGWRAGAAAGAPDWLTVGVAQLSRYEYLWNQFRVGAPGDDRGVSIRTLVAGQVRFDPLFFGAELEDARFYFDDDNAPLDTTLINTFELLQGYAGIDLRDVLMPGATGSLRGGRITMDIGARRLVARNRFRPTINAFTGADLQWNSPAQDTVRVFAVLPVHRLPIARQRLDDNDTKFDDESTDAFFWGVFLGSRPLLAGVRSEAYVFGLNEQDSGDTATRDRELVTPGFRVFRNPARGQLDLEIEAAAQVGTSRNTPLPADVEDLDHFAFFVHLGLGHTFATVWDPRLVALYDYASGDSDPEDGDNGRFDTLFGARRFEFGPTGIYGAFARSNIHGPGFRVDLKPHAAVEANLQYRPFWLAEKRDFWVTSGLRDTTGASGDFVGNQLEGRLMWRAIPGNLSLEVGFAQLWLGEFPETVPNSNGDGDPTYVYTQMELAI